MTEVHRSNAVADPQIPLPPCHWQPDDDGIYQTTCGNQFNFQGDEKPIENGFRFCPYCGSTLDELPYELPPPVKYCKKNEFCSRVAGHEGVCDDLPF